MQSRRANLFYLINSKIFPIGEYIFEYLHTESINRAIYWCSFLFLEHSLCKMKSVSCSQFKKLKSSLVTSYLLRTISVVFKSKIFAKLSDMLVNLFMHKVSATLSETACIQIKITGTYQEVLLLDFWFNIYTCFCTKSQAKR